MLKKNPDTSPSPAASDEWTARLCAAVQKDRRRFRLALWAVNVVAPMVLGLGVWWIYPRGSLPPVKIVAIDALCLPGEPAHLRGAD